MIKNNITYIIIAVIAVVAVGAFVIFQFDLFGGSSSVTIVDENISTSDIFSDSDLNENDFYDVCNVNLSSGTADNSMISISSGTYTITSTGTYVFTGSSTSSQIIVNTDDKVQIVLDDVTMSHASSAIINVIMSDKTFIRLDGDNSLTSTMSVADGDIDGAIFSMDNLAINGEGSLSISSKLNGIVGKDDITITNGDYIINSTYNGFDCNEELAICGGTFDVTTNGGQSNAPYQDEEESNFNNNNHFGSSGSSGSSSSSSDDDTWSCKAFKCDELIYITGGEFDVDSYDDAFHCDLNILIEGGEFDILTGDDALHANLFLGVADAVIDIDYCYEGLEAQRIRVDSGTVDIDAYNDGINANEASDTDDGNGTYIYINGGDITITIIEISNSPEADGMDSNGGILITGGTTMISGTTYTTDTPLDFGEESGGTAEITGGTFLTGGSYSMTGTNFESASQGAIYYTLSSSSYTSAGTTVQLLDSDNKAVVEYAPINKFQAVHISSPDIVAGETYSLVVGSQSYSVTIPTNNLYTSSSSSSRW